MTKKQIIRARNEAWKLALAEGRVVRFVIRTYPEQTELTSYPTIAARDAAIAKIGFGEIVRALAPR